MNSFPDNEKIAFDFSALRSTVDDRREHWQLLLRIVAEFSISVRGRLFFSEPEFTVVELATQLAEWTKSPSGDFDFVSMEAEEEPLIAFRVQPNGSYKIRSPWQKFKTEEEFESAELRSAVGRFLNTLTEETRQLGFEISSLL
jgi:hypothetical protein